MTGWLETHKPGASARVHLVLAALMWGVVGSAMLVVGVRWASEGRTAVTLWLLAAAAALGYAKSRWILDRAAGRIVERILARGDGRCLGGFLSVRTWLLVGFMVLVGRVLRSFVLAGTAAGLLYVVVGVALVLSSRLMWRAWRVAR
jgi:hypothetical protein